MGNKDSPPENEYMSFPRPQQDPQASFGDDMNRMMGREMMMRQYSGRLAPMENSVFNPGYVGEQLPPKNYFSNARNYENTPNDSFGGPNLSFKMDGMDFNDNGYGMNNFRNPHQNSFNNPFGDQGRNQGFGPDYPSNVMNPNSMQYNMSQMNYFQGDPNRGHAGSQHRRHNTFGNQR